MISPLLLIYIIAASVSSGLLAFTVVRSLHAGADVYTRRFTAESEATLAEMFIYMPASWILTLKVSCTIVMALIGALLGIGLPGYSILIPIFFLGIPAFFVPDIIIRRCYKDRLNKFRLQMIDGLQILANGMKSNLSFMDSIRLLVRESPEPLAGEFRIVIQEVNLGLSLERALENLTKRMPLQDLHLFVASINTVYSMGEGLVEVCEKAVAMVQERFKVERRIETLTAEGRTQALILTSAPFVLMGALYFIDPQLPAILFTTTAGFVILVMVIVLDALGYYFISKIIDIKV